MSDTEKSFVRKHIVGWILSGITLVVGLIANGIYGAFRSPVEAGIAAQQATNSDSAWALHQATQSGLWPALIIGATALFMVLFLIPTIKHAIQLAKTD